MKLFLYKEGWRYILLDDVFVQTTLRPLHDIKTKWYCLDTTGLLVISDRYAWDGATGFPDIPSVMRGALVHDALYQMIRLGQLPLEARKQADEMLKVLCLEDGMNPLLAQAVYLGVRLLGERCLR